jgi:hypothetical protein
MMSEIKEQPEAEQNETGRDKVKGSFDNIV